MGLERTWLVAVMKGEECLAAGNIAGSRNYIPLLMETCHILDDGQDLSAYEILLGRGSWSGRLSPDDIKNFAHAWRQVL